MIPQFTFKRYPHHPGWPARHPGCVSHWAGVRLYGVGKDTLPLITVRTARFDLPCVRAYAATETGRANNFYFVLHAALGTKPITLRMDQRLVTIPRRSYLIMNPKDHARLDPRSPFEGLTISLSQTLLRQYREMTGIPKTAGPFDFDPAPTRVTPAVQRAFDTLVGLIPPPSDAVDEAWNALHLFGAGADLLRALWRHHPNELRNRLQRKGMRDAVDPRLQRAIEYMRAHLDEPLKIVEVAEAAGISKTPCYRLFQEQLGCAPHQFFRQLKLDQAEQLLRLTPKPDWSRIAKEVGFGSAWALKKAFKKVKGQIPESVPSQVLSEPIRGESKHVLSKVEGGFKKVKGRLPGSTPA